MVRGGATLLLRKENREPAPIRRIVSSPSADTDLSKRAWLMLALELGRLAEPISQLWKERKRGVSRRPRESAAWAAPFRPD